MKDKETSKGISVGQETSLKTTAHPSGSEAVTEKSSERNNTSSYAPKQRKPVVNKRARGERFGLVQWQRLVRSSNDLAQRNGAPFRKNIPWEEIRKHNQPHDGWMVLRGIVYNIGPYLAYHPGGVEIFSKTKILGEDGTKLFDKYHRWVSIEGLIGELAIGSVASWAEHNGIQE